MRWAIVIGCIVCLSVERNSLEIWIILFSNDCCLPTIWISPSCICILFRSLWIKSCQRCQLFIEKTFESVSFPSVLFWVHFHWHNIESHNLPDRKTTNAEDWNSKRSIAHLMNACLLFGIGFEAAFFSSLGVNKYWFNQGIIQFSIPNRLQLWMQISPNELLVLVIRYEQCQTPKLFRSLSNRSVIWTPAASMRYYNWFESVHQWLVGCNVHYYPIPFVFKWRCWFGAFFPSQNYAGLRNSLFLTYLLSANKQMIRCEFV